MLPGGALGAGWFNSLTVASLNAACAFAPAGALLSTALRGMAKYSPPCAGFFFCSTQAGSMAELVNHLVQFALWSFFVIFAFAAVGVIVTIRWVVRLVTRTEAAVGSGVAGVENIFHKH
jgi:hypothetical protein